MVSVNEAVVLNVPPFRVIAAAVTEPLIAPKFKSVLTDNVPPETVTFPVKVFVPDKVKVPVPVFVSETAVLLPFCITPEKAVFVLLPPEVNVTAPAALLVIVPVPAIEPAVSATPFKSNIPGEVTTKAEASGILATALIFKVPLFIVVAPV